jgi:hypothetical protein
MALSLVCSACPAIYLRWLLSPSDGAKKSYGESWRKRCEIMDATTSDAHSMCSVSLFLHTDSKRVSVMLDGVLVFDYRVSRVYWHDRIAVLGEFALGKDSDHTLSVFAHDNGSTDSVVFRVDKHSDLVLHFGSSAPPVLSPNDLNRANIIGRGVRGRMLLECCSYLGVGFI